MSYLDENSLNMSGYSIQEIFIGMKKVFLKLFLNQMYTHMLD